MADPQKSVAFTTDVPLIDKNDSSQFLLNPTIAAGDFKVSVDGGAYGNMDNLPAVTPGASRTVRLIFSANEMSGENLTMLGIDVAGDEWQDVFIAINIPVSTVDNVFDVMEGDHVESSTSLVVNKKDTTTALINKKITGSLLSPSVTVTTKEP